MHCRMVSSISGLHPLNTRELSQSGQPRIIFKHCQMCSGRQITNQLRTTTWTIKLLTKDISNRDSRNAMFRRKISAFTQLLNENLST